jgi:hypothetical protein
MENLDEFAITFDNEMFFTDVYGPVGMYSGFAILCFCD